MSSIVNLPLPILDKILAIYCSGKAQKLALLASVCKSFSVPGRAVSVLNIDNSVETEGHFNVLETQFRLSRLIHLVPNVTKVKSSVEVVESTLYYWSRCVGRTLSSLEIPELKLNIVGVLHTFPILEELKVTVTSEVLQKDSCKNFRNFSNITKLEVEIERESPCGDNGFEKDNLVSFLELFPNLISLTLKSEQPLFNYIVGHSNISFLILELSCFDVLKIGCPNLQQLRLLFEKKGNLLYMEARKFPTEVEILGRLDYATIEMTCEVGKEHFMSSRNGCIDSRCLTTDVYIQCKSVKCMSLDVQELMYLNGEELTFPDLFWEDEEGDFNLSLHAPVKLEKKLLGPSFKEFRFTSKDRLEEEEIRVFKTRYKMLKRLYPNVNFCLSVGSFKMNSEVFDWC